MLLMVMMMFDDAADVCRGDMTGHKRVKSSACKLEFSSRGNL